MKRKKKLTIIIIAALVLIAAGVAGFLILKGSKDELAKVKQRGNNYLMSEEYDKAAEEFLAAIGLAPEDPVNYVQLSEAYIGLNDYENASIYLEEAARLTKNNTDPEGIEQYISICIMLADCYRSAGKEEDRVRVLKEAHDLTKSGRIGDMLDEYYPGPPRSDILGGEYSVEDGLKVTLSGDGDIYYTMDGSNPTSDSFLYKGSILLPIGNHVINAVVRNKYGLFSEVNSFTFFVKEVDYFVRAKNYTREKNYEAAIESYNKAIISDPGNAEAYYGLAQAYIATEAYDKAIETVLSGLSLIPDDTQLSELASKLKPQVKASVEPGTYISEDKITVSLSGGVKIFFTIDGSDPAENGTEYTKPIELEKGPNIIKAVAEDEYGKGDVTVFEYTVHYKDEGGDVPEQEDKKDTPDNGSSGNGSISTGNNKNTDGNSGSNNSTGGSTGGSGGGSKNTGLDDEGNIIWNDSNVEAAIRKQLGLKNGPVSPEMAEKHTGTIDLSGINVTTFSDLKWFKNMSVLICKGNDLKDAAFINSLKAERIIAAYSNMDEISAITNTDVLKNINHLGIRVASFSIGDMSVAELLGFFGYMNQVMGELDNLEYLDLSNNGLTDISLISQIKNIDKVRYLILRDNEIEDLSVLSGFNNLVYLDVTNNNITDFLPVDHVATVIGKN